MLLCGLGESGRLAVIIRILGGSYADADCYHTSDVSFLMRVRDEYSQIIFVPSPYRLAHGALHNPTILL